MFLLVLFVCVFFFYFLDGSKQRQKLRGKISNEKVRLTKTVDTYNKLYADNSVQLADIEAGNFPWKTELINEDGNLFFFTYKSDLDRVSVLFVMVLMSDDWELLGG